MKILKFGAVWCSGCLIMKPLFQEIEKEKPWLKTEYYDFDKNKEIFNQYGVNEILPTFIFLDKDNNEFLRLNGELKKDELIKIINENRDK